MQDFKSWKNTLSTSSVNDIFYGNQPIDLQKFASLTNDNIKNWFISKGLIDKFVQNAPKNDSEKTRKDLDVLLRKMKNVSPEDLIFARHIDDEKNIPKAFIDLLSKYGIEVSEDEHLHIEGQSDAILFYLKEVINRPRPYQLAYYYKLELFPLIRTNAMTAAYPSGHALVGFMMAGYYSKKYPEATADLKELGEKIAMSRENTGIHYPSDTEVSREIAKIIIDNNLLKD